MRYIAVVAAIIAVTLTFAQDFPPEFERPWEDWNPPVIEMPEPNSYHLYQLAFDLLEEFEWPGREATPEDMRASIEGFDLAYQALQQAQMGECRFPPLAEPEQVFPELANTRNACRFMAAHARVNVFDGRMAQAALDCVACVRLGAAASSNGTLIGGLTTVACEAIGLRELEEIIPGLQPDECRVVIEALRAAEADRVTLSEVLQGELLYGKMLMKRMFEDFPTQAEAQQTLAAMTPEDREKALREWDQLMQQGTELLNPDNSWRKHEEWFGLLIEETQKPYWDRDEVPPPGDLLVDIAVPVYLMTQVKFAIANAKLRLALCQLAAQAFMLDQGGPPRDLDQLVPEYIPSVPDDPFRDATLSSIELDGEFVIYSVGPDGEDNGGTPIEGYPDADSDGDMVVTL
jgi:hypothetical protein